MTVPRAGPAAVPGDGPGPAAGGPEASAPTYRIVVSDRVAPEGLAPLTGDDRFDVVFGAEWSRERLAEEVADADALIVRSGTDVTPDFLDAAARLRVIGRAGVGVDNIDLGAATGRGIPVLNAPSGNTTSAAELTLALILGLVRKVAPADRSIREGRWERSRFAGVELRGKTLGLVGAGRIGGEVAKRARAFRMVVVAHDPYLSADRAESLGVELVELDELLDRADVLSLHVPLTPSTRGLLGAEELGRMKSSAFVVNASRGGVVDEEALAGALADGEIAGAALDVYAGEPLPPDSPLREAPNTLLTPHLGASTAEAQESVALEIAEAVRAALLEGDLRRAVNAPAIGGEELRRIRPLLDLARRLGRLACGLAPGAVRSAEVVYAGAVAESLRPVAASVLTGLLTDVLGEESVNFVNALHLAESRGIDVTTGKRPPGHDYGEFLEVRLDGDAGAVDVAGALLGEQHPRVVRVGDYHVDVVPRGTLLVLRNRDVPGVIGRVGTLLGSHDLNIAEYHQARRSAGGEALAAVSVDGALTPEVLDALRELPEIEEARQVELG